MRSVFDGFQRFPNGADRALNAGRLLDGGMFDLIDRFFDEPGRYPSAADAPKPVAAVNLIKVDDASYRLEMALPGFTEDDIEITVEGGTLTVKGKPVDQEEETGRYLRRGFAPAAFENRFNLADHVEVVEAQLANGVLSIALKREIPEAEKPRRIEIGGQRKIANA